MRFAGIRTFADDPHVCPCEARLWIPFARMGRSVENFVLVVFCLCSPPKMLRMDASFAALTATMRCLRASKGRIAMFQSTHRAMAPGEPTAKPHCRVSLLISRLERPYQACWAVIIYMSMYPSYGSATLSNHAIQRIAIFAPLGVVPTAISLCEKLAPALWNRADHAACSNFSSASIVLATSFKNDCTASSISRIAISSLCTRRTCI